MNANKNKKLKEQSKIRETGGKMQEEADDDSVQLDNMREVNS